MILPTSFWLWQLKFKNYLKKPAEFFCCCCCLFTYLYKAHIYKSNLLHLSISYFLLESKPENEVG